MAMVDHGVIIFSDSIWLKVKPRCPQCGHIESDWGVVHMGIPQHQYDKRTQAHGCSKCGHRFVITAYHG